MIPTHALRIQTMLRSMIEVIIPALDPHSQLARDQAQILVGNLRLLAAQADRTYEYDIVELRELVDLLRRCVADAQGGPSIRQAREEAEQALAWTEPTAALAVPRHRELSMQARQARAAVDGLLTASRVDGTAEFRRQIVAAVLSQCAAQNLRERVWFAAAGLDADSSALPTMDHVLGAGFAE